MKIKILSQEDIKKVITMKDAINAMSTAFSQLFYKKVEIPLRTSISQQQQKGMSLFMPGFLRDEQQLGIKVVSIFPNNSEKNLPAITSAILLLNAETGAPLAMMDGTYLTALRTGAVSGLATDLLAKDDATTVAIIGAGVQARTQLEAVSNVRDIHQVNIYARNKQKATEFAKEIESFLQAKIDVFDNISKACSHADIICTATSSTQALIANSDVKDDCHINAIGSHTPAMHEIDVSILQQASNIVDQKHAVLAEAGEFIDAVNNNSISEGTLIELGEVVVHPEKFSSLKNRLTVFKSVGLAIQDISVADAVLKLADQQNIGVQVDL